MKTKLILAIVTALLCVMLTSACHSAITLTYLDSFSLNGSTALDVVVVGDYAYVAASSSTFSKPGLYVVNLTDTSLIKICEILGARDVSVQGDYAYVACTAGMAIVNIANPMNPILLDSYYAPGSNRDVQRICVSGSYAYLQCMSTGSTPPSLPYYNYYYDIVDIANPYLPQFISRTKSDVLNTSYRGFGIAAYEDIVYATDKFLSLFNVANPANPALTTGDSMGKSGSDVFVDDSFLYNINSESTAASPPSNLQIRNHSGALLGSCRIDNIGTVKRLSVSGKYAYISRLTSGLSVIDISNPLSPSLLTTATTPGIAYGLCAAGDYLYVADGTSGLSIYSINGQVTSVDLKVDPVSPRYVGTPVTLIASGYPGNDPWYEFRAGANVLRANGPGAKYVWTPNTAGNYALTVAAEDYTGQVVVSPVVNYSVIGHVSNVSLSANLASPQPLGSTITLTASATGGTGLTYDFYDGGNMLATLDNTSPTFAWTPSSEGLHMLKVVARDSGGVAIESSAVNFTVGTVLSSVSLSASPVSPQLIGTQVTLTATAVGGSGLQYKFMSGLEILRDFSSANTFDYTVSFAKNYQLSVIAKDASGTTVTSSAISFDAISPVKSVSLSASPISPQLVGTQLTLTANAIGGTGLQYAFYSGTYALRGFTSSNTMTWTFTTPGTRLLTVVAKDSTGKTVKSSDLSFVVSPFSVSLSASPISPQMVGTQLTLTANAIGGTGLQYAFYSGTYALRGFAASNTMTWTFTTPGTRLLTVIAKDSTGRTAKSSDLSFVISSFSVSLAASPASPQPANAVLTLTATAVGGTNVQYKFMSGTYTLRNFAASNIYTYKFLTAGTRSLTVVAKDASGKTTTSPALNYTMVPAVNNATLTAGPVSPQLAGTNITLTAAASGGIGVEYKFLSGTYVLRDFSSTKTMTWIFTTPGTRQFTVVARDSAGNISRSAAVSYTVLPSIQSVSLSATPSSLQLPGTVTLTATAVGGEGITYRFMSGTFILRDYAASNTASWTFTTAGTRQLTVQAKDVNGKIVTSAPLAYVVTTP